QVNPLLNFDVIAKSVKTNLSFNSKICGRNSEFHLNKKFPFLYLIELNTFVKLNYSSSKSMVLNLNCESSSLSFNASSVHYRFISHFFCKLCFLKSVSPLL